MIINISRMKSARTCWHRAFNQYHRRLEGPRSMNLVDGGAFHDGVAWGMATHDWSGAHEKALERFERELAESSLPPEQAFLAGQHRELVETMIECYRANYEHEEYQVIQPECKFDVELPGGRHHCLWLHHIDCVRDEEVWGPPAPETILTGGVISPHTSPDEPCACYVPHRFVGTTDNIVAWHHNIWTVDHKTTAISGPQFWDQWLIDVQMTGYLYGVWKSLNVRPRGFIINAIHKPSEAQVASWNSRRKYGEPKQIKDYISFERQAFTRTEEDLWRFERQIVNIADEWERRMLDGYFDMDPTPGACLAYNRRCDFFQACLAHDEPRELAALAERPQDYVDDKLYEIINAKETTK